MRTQDAILGKKATASSAPGVKSSMPSRRQALKLIGCTALVFPTSGRAQVAATCNGTFNVYYGTGRDRLPSSTWPDWYGTGTGPMRFGVVKVDTCDPGLLEIRHRPAELARSSLLTRLGQEVAASGGEVTVVIPGYGNYHPEVVMNGATLKAKAGLRGPVYVIDWPSNGTVFPQLWYYGRDRTRLQEHRHAVRQQVRDILKLDAVKTLHIVGHSMGAGRTGGIASSIQDLHASDDDRPLLGKLGKTVLAAADMHEQDFDSFHEVMRHNRKPLWLLVCKWDYALRASEFWNGNQPIGSTSQRIFVRPGVTTIDASEVVSFGLGHSYMYSERSVHVTLEAIFRGIIIPRSEERAALGGRYRHLLR